MPARPYQQVLQMLRLHITQVRQSKSEILDELLANQQPDYKLAEELAADLTQKIAELEAGRMSNAEAIANHVDLEKRWGNLDPNFK